MYLTTEMESIDGMITSPEISILSKLKLTRRETDEDFIEISKAVEEEDEYKKETRFQGFQ